MAKKLKRMMVTLKPEPAVGVLGVTTMVLLDGTWIGLLAPDMNALKQAFKRIDFFLDFDEQHVKEAVFIKQEQVLKKTPIPREKSAPGKRDD